MASDLRCLFLWIFLQHIDICLGFSLGLSGSPNCPSYTLTCTVTDAAGLDDLVLFNRQTSPAAVVSIEQSPTRGCTEFSYPKDYNVSCGTGTEETTSESKTYTVKINNVADIDRTDWWCSLQTNKTQSNNHRVTCESQTTTPQTGQTTAQQTGPGESLDWCIAVSAVLAVLIVVGIVILILVVKEPFDDKILKTLGIVLIVVGACVIVTAVVTAILLAVKTNVDRTDGSWIAAVAFCALGFLFGAVFCAVGVIKMSKLSKKDSKPVSGNSRELRNETGTPLNK